MIKVSINIVLIFILTLNSFGTVYYIRTDGNDSNLGTSNTSGGAWKTGAKAASVNGAGDEIRVQPGDYPERVTISASGNAANRINWVSESVTNATFRGFNLTGNYISITAFNLTQTNDLGFPGVATTGTNNWVNDNYIHETSQDGACGGISFGNAKNSILRGNIIYKVGIYGATPLNSPHAAFSSYNGSPDNRPIRIEFNNASHVDDYLRPAGGGNIYRFNILGPTATNDFPGLPDPHVDGFQDVVIATNCFDYCNYHVDNLVPESHMLLSQVDGSIDNTVVKNVSIRSGDQLHGEFRFSDNWRLAHNTVGQVGIAKGGPQDVTWWFPVTSTNNVSKNNIFTNTSSTTRIYEVSADSSLAASRDIGYPFAVANSTGAINADPQFVDYGNYDFRLKVTSPGVDAGTNLTTTTAGGSSTTSVTVADSRWFHGGFSGFMRGMYIYVGSNNNILVDDVNYGTGTLTVHTAITFSNGDSVGYSYRGSGPDIGAYEYGDTFLTAATISNIGTTYTVSVTGDCLYVLFYKDGIPVSEVYDAPYTYTSAGTITAKAMAAHPQNPIIINASAGASQAGSSFEVRGTQEVRGSLIIR